jgi:DNA recombination protein RmuC
MESQYSIVFLIFSLLLGVIIGVALTFLLTRSKNSSSNADTALKLEFEAERSRLQSDLNNAKRALEEQKQYTNQREVYIGELNAQLFNLNSQKATLEEKLRNEMRNAAEKLSVINEAQQKMTDSFSALSKQALDQNNQSFVSHAEQVFKRFQESAQSDLQQRQEKISEIVLPVQESLALVDSHISELERERLDAYATIREQISQMTNSQQKLSDTTSQLVNVLRNTKTRGRWGEIQLRRVVELAGMTSYCDFCEQFSVAGEDGRQQPDMIIKLPSQRTIVIDAKAPMDAFLSAHDATDDEVKRHHFLQHAKSLRRHVGQLSLKSYAENFSPSPEFVLMFLPSEAIYSAALEHDADLIEYGALKNVIIATPSTLIALLKAAAYGWQQEAVTKEVKQVGELGKQLYKRLVSMTEHIVKVGESLDKSVKSYNSMIGSIERSVLPSARRFKDLHVIGGASEEIAALETIERVSREFQAGEFKSAAAGINQNVSESNQAGNSDDENDLLNL